MHSAALYRLSLVRFGASFLVILTTGILNRLLIVDVGLSALLVTVVLSFQNLTSPLALWTGHLSDRLPIGGRRRVPWIRLWTVVAAGLVPLMPAVTLRMSEGPLWIALGAAVFGLFGFGLKAANLLVGALLVDATADGETRGRQLSVIWTSSIAGFIVAALYFRVLLPVFDPDVPTDLDRLQELSWATAAIAVALAWIGTAGVEPKGAPEPRTAPPRLLVALRGVLASRRSRRLFAFLVVADFSFFVQEFVLESFGGDIFDMPVNVTTSFNITFGLGMMLAMIAAGGLGVLISGFPTRRVLATACALGAISFAVLAFSAVADASTALLTSVFVLGVAKGLYNVGLSHLFMALADSPTAGLLMGAWGAFGGFAVALGGLTGGVLRDAALAVTGDLATAYGLVFGVEVLGMIAALMVLLRGGERV